MSHYQITGHKHIHNVLLVDPPQTRPPDFSARVSRVGVVQPLGLAYIAAVLLQEGLGVKITDCVAEGIDDGEKPYAGGYLRYGLSDDEIALKIKEFEPDMVGVSCLFSNKIWDAHNICRIAKQVLPDVTVVMGGSHPSAMPERELQDKNLDFVVIGEGEYVLLTLIRVLNNKESPDNLESIAYRENGHITVLPRRSYIIDLDKLPLPARHLLRMDKYLSSSSSHTGSLRTPYTQMITSRGCPARCSFCAIRGQWGANFRPRSPKDVLKEIELLVRIYGVREIHFEDDNLTFDKDRAIKIFDGIIQRKLDIVWTVPSGVAVWALDEELLGKMRESGCYGVSLPIESGDQEVLSKLMHKPIRLSKVIPLVRKARQLGMKTRGFFILGYPGETKEQMRKTIDFAKTLELDWCHFFIATPLPGTELYEICKEKGYFKYGEPDFTRSFYKAVIETPEFSAEYVERLREQANIEVNFRNNPNLLKYDIDMAISDFKYVLMFYSHLPYAHFYLGKAYAKKGLVDKAVAEWQKTLELDPQYVEAEEDLREFGK